MASKSHLGLGKALLVTSGMLTAAAAWGYGTHLMRRHLTTMPIIALTFWMLVLTLGVMMIAATTFEMARWRMPTTLEWASIGYNMVLAIVATVVSVIGCCLPWGAVSLIFAMQVNKKLAAGDTAGAANASKQAKMFAWIAIILGVICLIINIVFGGLAFLMAALGNR